jgi:hypothetical protein
MRRFALLLTMIVLSATLAGSWLPAQQPASSTASTPVKAQTNRPAAPDGPPSAAQVMKLLELLQVRDSLQVTLDAVKRQMRNNAEDQFREKILNPSAEQLKSIQAIVDDAFGSLSADDMIKDVVPCTRST